MKIHDIESAKNQIYQDLLSLLGSSGISELGQALIFGSKATMQVEQEHPESVVGLIVQKDMIVPSMHSIDRVYKLPKDLFCKIDVFGTNQAVLIIKVPKIEKLEATTQLKGCSLIIPFQDPSNVGALLRTAAGFGVNQILLAPGAANPFHSRSTRAASGVILKHKYYKFTDAKNFSQPCIALDSTGTDLKKFKFPKDFILMPGVEGQGLSDELKSVSTAQISIPLSEGVESLNATVAAGIALYSWHAQNS